jgi:ABC-type spermidine/putrescine transport system permease subunit II
MAATEELIKIAARVVLQQMTTPYRAAFERRIVGAAICGIVALIAIIAAVVCGVAAFWHWLTPTLGATTAALVTMAALVVIGLILGLTAVALLRRSPSSALRDVFDAKEIGKLIEGHLPELMLAAAIGGLLFGMKRRK